MPNPDVLKWGKAQGVKVVLGYQTVQDYYGQMFSYYIALVNPKAHWQPRLYENKSIAEKEKEKLWFEKEFIRLEKSGKVKHKENWQQYLNTKFK